MRNACLPCQLRKSYAVLWAANRFVGFEAPKHNGFDEFWKLKFHFEHFPKNTRFLSFDGPSNYLHWFLRTTDRHFLDQGNARHPTSKFLKCDLVETLHFRTLIRGFLLPGRQILFYIASPVGLKLKFLSDCNCTRV